jgi:prolipoprotein diacylglyceryl transferase
MAHPAVALPQFIPSPPANGFHVGPMLVHYYALGYIIGITFAVLITRRRWRALGGNPDVVNDIALWVVPAGIIGGRIYFDITTPADIPHVWYGPVAVWTGGLGIWGGVLLAALVGAWRLRKMGLSVGPFANAIAPGLLVAQAVGRIGNYFNIELFGKPTTLPWGLEVPVAFRPVGYTQFATFQPSFLYELIWDLALAAFLVWLGHHAKIKYWGLFALYVAGYSAYRIFEESIRIDSSEHFLGLRLNMYIAIIGTLAGLIWFVIVQRRPQREAVVASPPPSETPDSANALDDATDSEAGADAADDTPESAETTLAPEAPATSAGPADSDIPAVPVAATDSAEAGAPQADSADEPDGAVVRHEPTARNESAARDDADVS